MKTDWSLAALYFLATIIILVLFFTIYGLGAVLDISGSALFLVPIFFILQVFLYSIFGVRFLLASFILIVPFQPFLTMPLSTHISSLELKLLVALKECFVVLMLLAVSKRLVNLNFILSDYLALTFLILYSVGLVAAGFGMVQLVSFREGFMLVAMYFLGRSLYFFDLTPEQFALSIFAVATVVAVFGVVERFLIGEWFWPAWGAVDYLDAKFAVSTVNVKSYEGIPHNWYTFVGNELMRRMTATIGDATSFGRYVAFAVVAFIYQKNIRSRSWSYIGWVICICGLIFSLGRGGILIAVICGGVWLYKYRRYRMLTIPILLLIGGFIGSTALFSIDGANSVRHMDGLNGGLDAMFSNPVGHGLGSSGQMAVLYSDMSDEEVVSESYIGSLGYQLGLPGVVFYSLWLLVMSNYLYKVGKKNRHIESSANMAVGLLIGLYSTSFFANSAVAPISSSAVVIFVGLVMASSKEFQGAFGGVRVNE